MNTETWRPVVGWENLYEVSNLGQVRSLTRLVHRRHTRPYIQYGRTLSPGSASNGYLTVALSKDGVQITKPVHDLVLRAFVGPPPPGMECLHGANGKLDNRLEHLSYGTRTQNCLDMQRDGTDYHCNLTHCPFGHKLALPNLVRSTLTRGYRGCLACARARANCHYAQRMGRAFDFHATAEEHYGRIMG